MRVKRPFRRPSGIQLVTGMILLYTRKVGTDITQQCKTTFGYHHVEPHEHECSKWWWRR